MPQIARHISSKAIIYNDELSSCNKLSRVYDHQTVIHSRGEYVRGRVNTNSIESFWALLKRGIVGIYHFTFKKHLQLYVDEFVFRYNSRQNSKSGRFNLRFIKG